MVKQKELGSLAVRRETEETRAVVDGVDRMAAAERTVAGKMGMAVEEVGLGAEAVDLAERMGLAAKSVERLLLHSCFSCTVKQSSSLNVSEPG